MTTTSPAGTPVRSTPGQRALQWWERLRDPSTGNPGALAELRRCRSTPEAVRLREALVLARRLGGASGASPDWRTRAALDLARVLAHVREHDPAQHPMRAAGWKHFAGSRRESDAGEDRPVLSEARFRRLLQVGDGEEKVSAFSRLVALLGNRVRVDDLASDFLLWNHPDRGDSVREHWAFLYFAAGAAAPAPQAGPTSDSDDES